LIQRIDVCENEVRDRVIIWTPIAKYVIEMLFSLARICVGRSIRDSLRDGGSTGHRSGVEEHLV